MNLIDSFEHSIDEKGRLVLPSVYREQFFGGAVVSAKGDHLAVYTLTAWNEFLEELRVKRKEGLLDRRSFNLVVGLSSQVKIDSQGRVSISSRLRDSAKLEKDVIVQGADDYLAIYAVTAIKGSDELSVENVMNTLNELGL